MAVPRVRRVFLTILTALLALPLLASTALAQAGVITGKVTSAEGGTPIADVTVEALGGTKSYVAVTGDDGVFRIVNVADGTYTLVARKPGLAAKSTANVRPGSTLDFTMAAQTNMLATMTTTSRPMSTPR